MKIIEPAVEFVNKPDWEKAIKQIELCGRTCYKSEHRITDNSAKVFIKNLIKRGHEAVLEHFSFTVRFTCDRGVTHQIVRHRIASYCVTGDTVIPSFSTTKRSTGKKRTIAELYRWQNDPKCHAALKALRIRSVDETTHTIVPGKVKKIFYNGEKEVFFLKTESGRNIKCTKDHRLLNNNEWKQLKELKEGDYIYANGLPLLENEDWIRHNYLILNKTRKQVAAEIGCSEGTLFKVFKRFGIFKPWSNRPNHHPGRGKKGMFSKEAREKISKRMQGEKNPSYKQNRNEISVHGGYSESHRKFGKTACELCGCKENLEIHHVDKNPRHNTRDNIKILCSKCHHLAHWYNAMGVFRDKIIEIKRIGIEAVYDIEVDGEFHNYVANGIVVHNCQESTRYCRYDDDKFDNQISVIKPCFFEPGDNFYELWKQSCEQSEKAYFDLLEKGAKPEEARSVLPNSLKTELVMTTNIREWRHFLKLRSSAAAHPQIRELACMLLVLCDYENNVLFQDIQPSEI